MGDGKARRVTEGRRVTERRRVGPTHAVYVDVLRPRVSRCAHAGFVAAGFARFGSEDRLQRLGLRHLDEVASKVRRESHKSIFLATAARQQLRLVQQGADPLHVARQCASMPCDGLTLPQRPTLHRPNPKIPLQARNQQGRCGSGSERSHAPSPSRCAG